MSCISSKKKVEDSNQNDDVDDEDMARYVAAVEGHLMLEKDVAETLCGLATCTPTGIQWFARKEVFLVFYWIVGIIQGMFFTYSVSILSTVEKRFKLNSKATGIMLSGNDISQVMLAIIVSYFCNYGNRPRWMGLGILFIALSAFTAALPHFIYGPGQDALNIIQSQSTFNETSDKSRNIELCHVPFDPSCESENEGFQLGPVVFLFLAQFFTGIGGSIYWSIGMPYLDDNISKKTSPQYYAVSYIVRIIGPVMGFLLGSQCLSLWIDPDESPTISPKDPRWLGAWWLGFIYIGIGLSITGLLVVFFPRKLPETLQREVRSVAQQFSKEEKRGGKKPLTYFVEAHRSKQTKESPSMKNLPKALMRLFTNKIYMGNLFNTCTYLLAISGYWSFKSKYLENQFMTSASEANKIMGISSTVSTVLGVGFSGIMMRCWKPSARFITGYLILLTLWSGATYVSLMFVGCPKLDIVGPVATVEGSVPPSCSLDCGCTDRFEPVCSSDSQIVFYSACYAGCSSVDTSLSPPLYSDCRCINNSTLDPLIYTATLTGINLNEAYSQNKNVTPGKIMNENLDIVLQKSDDNWRGTAVRGYCEGSCDAMIYYIAIEIVSSMIHATGRVGGVLILLRCVEDRDKGLALGTMTVVMSLFAFIPGPIIFGAVVDSACLVWDTTCGKEGNCWFYDSEKFRYVLHIVPAIIIFISVLGDLVVFYYSDEMDIYGERDADVDQTDDGRETELCKEEKDCKTEMSMSKIDTARSFVT